MKITIIIFILVAILINLTSPWFYRIFGQEMIISVFLLIITFGLFAGLLISSPKLIAGNFIVLIIISILLAWNHFDKNLFIISSLDSAFLTQRVTYYPKNTGKFIHNPATLMVYKYQRNIMTNLDFNQFFSGGRPRLRPYALDFEKYPLADIIFFIYGLWWVVKYRQKIFLLLAGFIGIILLITSFVTPNYLLGPYSLYPLVGSIICAGLYQLIIKVREIFKKR